MSDLIVMDRQSEQEPLAAWPSLFDLNLSRPQEPCVFQPLSSAPTVEDGSGRELDGAAGERRPGLGWCGWRGGRATVIRVSIPVTRPAAHGTGLGPARGRGWTARAVQGLLSGRGHGVAAAVMDPASGRPAGRGP